MFTFKHMRSPGWASGAESSIYFKVVYNNEEIGYIGCQECDWGRGIINNLCYKTFEPHRGKGLTKAYIKEFVDSSFLDVDVVRAKVPRDNIASIKVLEYAGFENRGKRDEGTKFGFTWKRF